MDLIVVPKSVLAAHAPRGQEKIQGLASPFDGQHMQRQGQTRFVPVLSSCSVLSCSRLARGGPRALSRGSRGRLAAAREISGSGSQAPRPSKQARKVAKLRSLLAADDILKGPCCHDALSAHLIDLAGFDFAFMSGFTTSASRLGAPDTGLISYAEMASQGRDINEVCSIPVIGDGDTGYGNAMNVKRTIRGYAASGFAGILIEDQVAPKRCGHTSVKGVVPRPEAVTRIRAAVDARDEGDDIVIVARTDARQAVSLEEALWRVRAFADAGADVLFIDGLASVEEMQALCDVGKETGKPTMANMLEGGKTPILPPGELQGMGFSLVAYPLSLLGAAIKGMQDALASLQDGTIPPTLPSFQEIQAAVGFPEYWEESERYTDDDDGDGSKVGGDAAVAAEAETQPPAPEEVLAPEVEVVEATIVEGEGGGYGGGADGGGPTRWIRVRVTSASGARKFSFRAPAAGLSRLAKIVPTVAGLDLATVRDEPSWTWTRATATASRCST